MGVISTGLLDAGLKSDFFNRFGTVAKHHELLATRLPSSTASEKYRWLGTVPQIRQWDGGRLAKGLRSESYDIANLKYEATIEVDRDELSDDQTGQIRLRVQELAQRAATHPTILIEHLLNHGHESGYHSYDGVPFFGATHSSGASGSQDNDLTYTAVSADAPTAAEFRGALGQAIASMIGFKDDQGEPLRADPTSGLVCVVPCNMYLTALESLHQSVVPSATELKPSVLQGAAQVIALPGLTDASAWFLCKTDVPVRAFVFQDREPIEFGSLVNNSDQGFTREKFLFGVRARYAMAYGYWQFCVKNDFTAGG